MATDPNGRGGIKIDWRPLEQHLLLADGVKYAYFYRPRFALTAACAAMILLAMADVAVGEVRALLY